MTDTPEKKTWRRIAPAIISPEEAQKMVQELLKPELYKPSDLVLLLNVSQTSVNRWTRGVQGIVNKEHAEKLRACYELALKGEKMPVPNNNSTLQAKIDTLISCINGAVASYVAGTVDIPNAVKAQVIIQLHRAIKEAVDRLPLTFRKRY